MASKTARQAAPLDEGALEDFTRDVRASLTAQRLPYRPGEVAKVTAVVCDTLIRFGREHGDHTICLPDTNARKRPKPIRHQRADLEKELLADVIWFRGTLPPNPLSFARPLRVDAITLACEVELAGAAGPVLEEFVKLTAVHTAEHLIVFLTPERWTRGAHVEDYSLATFDAACTTFQSLTPTGTGRYAAIGLVPPPGREGGQWHNRVRRWKS